MELGLPYLHNKYDNVTQNIKHTSKPQINFFWAQE